MLGSPLDFVLDKVPFPCKARITKPDLGDPRLALNEVVTIFELVDEVHIKAKDRQSREVGIPAETEAKFAKLPLDPKCPPTTWDSVLMRCRELPKAMTLTECLQFPLPIAVALFDDIADRPAFSGDVLLLSSIERQRYLIVSTSKKPLSELKATELFTLPLSSPVQMVVLANEIVDHDYYHLWPDLFDSVDYMSLYGSYNKELHQQIAPKVSKGSAKRQIPTPTAHDKKPELRASKSGTLPVGFSLNPSPHSKPPVTTELPFGFSDDDQLSQKSEPRSRSSTTPSRPQPPAYGKDIRHSDSDYLNMTDQANGAPKHGRAIMHTSEDYINAEGVLPSPAFGKDVQHSPGDYTNIKDAIPSYGKNVTHSKTDYTNIQETIEFSKQDLVRRPLPNAGKTGEYDNMGEFASDESQPPIIRDIASTVAEGRKKGGRPLASYSTADVQSLLSELNLGQYGPQFAAKKIDGKKLKSLRAEDLKALGVESRLHQGRITECVQHFQFLENKK